MMQLLNDTSTTVGQSNHDYQAADKRGAQLVPDRLNPTRAARRPAPGVGPPAAFSSPAGTFRSIQVGVELREVT